MPPQCSLERGPHRKTYQLMSLKLSSMCKAFSQAVLGRMDATHRSCDPLNTPPRVTLGASNVSWSVKTRRAPSRRCRDAMVYRLTTTAMHDIEHTPHPSHSRHRPPPSHAPLFFRANLVGRTGGLCLTSCLRKDRKTWSRLTSSSRGWTRRGQATSMRLNGCRKIGHSITPCETASDLAL